VAGPPAFFQLLRTRVGLTDKDLTVKLPAGEPVAVRFPAQDEEEIAEAGAERLHVSLESFLDPRCIQ
jgi:hypothetical protein